MTDQSPNYHYAVIARALREIDAAGPGLTLETLADRIGLSPSPCLRRVRALEDSGIISGYRALLNTKALGYSLMALIYISMDKHTPERFEHFDQEIGLIPEVVECLLITGQAADYQLKVVAHNMDAFQELLLNRSGLNGIALYLQLLAGFAAATLLLAVWLYRRQLQTQVRF